MTRINAGPNNLHFSPGATLRDKILKVLEQSPGITAAAISLKTGVKVGTVCATLFRMGQKSEVVRCMDVDVTHHHTRTERNPWRYRLAGK
jgi:hypothetical protein